MARSPTFNYIDSLDYAYQFPGWRKNTGYPNVVWLTTESQEPRSRQGQKKLVSNNIREHAILTRLHRIQSTGRQGVGMSHFQRGSKASAAGRSTMVQAEVRRTEGVQRKARSTEGLNEGGPIGARVNMGRPLEEGPG